MGLLDWQPDDADAFFPDYTGSAFDGLPSRCSKTKNVPVLRVTTDHHARTSSACSSATTTSSALSKTSSSASLNSLLRSTPSSAHPASAAPKPRRRAATFDCYGADDELQTAEPRIDYCVMCLKHCKVHCKA